MDKLSCCTDEVDEGKVVGELVLLLPLARACIHDRLDHRVVESLQHYGEIHPFDENTHDSGTCPDGSSIDYYVEPSTTIVESSTERGHSVAKMVTPNVAAFAKSHFGCDSLTGAEIEQQDGSGCLGSHWERIFEPEYMSSVDSFRNVFSALTLAFFEDSGWYRANVSAAERLHFGENRGCDFATEKCINPATGVSIASDHFWGSRIPQKC